MSRVRKQWPQREGVLCITRFGERDGQYDRRAFAMLNGELDGWLRGQNSGRLFLSLNDEFLASRAKLHNAAWI